MSGSRFLLLGKPQPVSRAPVKPPDEFRPPRHEELKPRGN